jgi:hypothetical protein
MYKHIFELVAPVTYIDYKSGETEVKISRSLFFFFSLSSNKSMCVSILFRGMSGSKHLTVPL